MPRPFHEHRHPFLTWKVYCQYKLVILQFLSPCLSPTLWFFSFALLLMAAVSKATWDPRTTFNQSAKQSLCVIAYVTAFVQNVLAEEIFGSGYHGDGIRLLFHQQIDKPLRLQLSKIYELLTLSPHRHHQWMWFSLNRDLILIIFSRSHLLRMFQIVVRLILSLFNF